MSALEARFARPGTVFAGILLVAILGTVLSIPARAGQITGKVIHRGAAASIGMLTPSGPLPAYTPQEWPEGAILVYVGEAAGELPQRRTAGARLRMTSGGLVPELQAVAVGSSIELENADASAHRLQGVSGHGSFDIGWQAGGTARTYLLDTVGVIKLHCSLHERELGELIVLPHAAFVLTDSDGNFSLPDLPPGPATIVAYASGYGEVSRQVEIPKEGELSVRLAF